MGLKEVMEELGMDYEGVLNRFGGSSALAERILRKFPNDPSFAGLQEAVKTENGDGMLNYAHTLKGVAGNLGVERLYEACQNMVACLRADDLAGAGKAYALVETEYRRTLDGISKL